MAQGRILLAEPDPDISHMLQLYLETADHEVNIVANAHEVLPTARSWQPNALVLSSEFEDEDPLQLCRALIEDALTGHIPIIFLLHIDDRRLKLNILELGVDDIITKPFDIEELKLRIEAAIRLASLQVQV
ncbi:MAG: PleD family two-component system response regulator [Anaerolineae bacterium]